jgi:hypothetical protein
MPVAGETGIAGGRLHLAVEATSAMELPEALTNIASTHGRAPKVTAHVAARWASTCETPTSAAPSREAQLPAPDDPGRRRQPPTARRESASAGTLVSALIRRRVSRHAGDMTGRRTTRSRAIANTERCSSGNARGWDHRDRRTGEQWSLLLRGRWTPRWWTHKPSVR